MGSHQNKLDGKGRVSIPAPFRGLLRRYAGASDEDAACRMVLRRSHQFPCVEAWPEAVFSHLMIQHERMDAFSADYTALGATIFAEGNPVDTDREGRIALPDPMSAHIGIAPGGTVQFVGFGRHFRLWHPDAWAVELQRAREYAATQQLTISLSGFGAPA